MSGKSGRSSTANQRNSSGRFRGQPASSILDNGRRCENASALRIIKMEMNRTKQKLFHLSTRNCFSGIHTKQFMPDEIINGKPLKSDPNILTSDGAGCHDQVVRRTTNISNLVVRRKIHLSRANGQANVVPYKKSC